MTEQMGDGAPDEHDHTGPDDGGDGVGPTNVDMTNHTLTDPAGNAISGALQVGGSERSYVDSRSATNTSLSLGTWTTIIFDDEREDNQTEFDPTTYEFVPSETAFYHIIISASFAVGASGDNLALRVYNKTTSTVINSYDFQAPDADPISIQHSTILQLTGGDTYVFQAYNNDSSDTVRGITSKTYLNILEMGA